ncbi:MAG: glycosyltransferase [Treponema sp.]|nr:glycosyltransferase [Treponema sp.]
MHPDVSVIVPIYRIEKYLHRCLDSILTQTYSDFECILVDDASPDDCPLICDEYTKKDNRFKVIHKQKNEGLPQARKTGLSESSGNYILFADGDDWIEPDTIERMYKKAIETNSDMVVSDMFINTENTQRKDNLPEIYNKIDIYKHIISNGLFGTSVCNKLLRRNIYLKAVFPFHNFIEDRVITIQTIYYAEKIEFISDAFYHYCRNYDSICSADNENSRLVDEYYNFLLIIDFLADKGLITHLENVLIYRINSLKLSLLRNSELRYLYEKSLTELYPKSTKHIRGIMNFIFLSLGKFKSKITYRIIDFLIHTENVIKYMYRMIIPKNIRSLIWKFRNKNK